MEVTDSFRRFGIVILCLLQEHTKEELDSWKIVRVSEDFRVIALGLPVPKFKGNPLDPPLRSRFQARDIYYLPFKVSPRTGKQSLTEYVVNTEQFLFLHYSEKAEVRGMYRN